MIAEQLAERLVHHAAKLAILYHDVVAHEGLVGSAWAAFEQLVEPTQRRIHASVGRLDDRGIMGLSLDAMATSMLGDGTVTLLDG